MDIEKIIYLAAIAVYGIFSTVLSIVRTLKTSKISSDVKAVHDRETGKELSDVGNADSVEHVSDDDLSVPDRFDGLAIPLDELSDFLNEIRARKK